MKEKRKPRDLNQLAADIVRRSTEEDRTPQAQPIVKDPAAVALGRKGGKKGGKVRADRLTADRRKEIARIAAQTRWGKSAD